MGTLKSFLLRTTALYAALLPDVANAVSFAGATFASFIVQAAVSFVISTVISLVMGALFSGKKPKLPTANRQLRDITRSIREPVAPREIVYGEVRKGGIVTFVETSNANARLHMVYTVAAHEVEAIDTYFINEEPFTDRDLDSTGLIKAGKFANHVRIQKHLGDPSDTSQPFPDLASAVTNWTSTHLQRGCAKVYIRYSFEPNIFANGIPNASFWVKGKKVVDPRVGSTTAWTANPATLIRDYIHLSTVDGGLGATSLEINDTFTNAAANTSDEIVSTQTVSTKVSTVNVSGDFISLQGSTIKIMTGDRITFETTGSTPTPFVAGTQYFVKPTQRHGGPKIEVASTLAKAYLGSTITITDAGSGSTTVNKTGEPRYTLNGVVRTDEEPVKNLEELLSSMAGSMSWSNGQYHLRAGSWPGSDITFTLDDIISPVQLSTDVGRKEKFNAVKGIYTTVLNKDQQADYPPVTNATYQTEDLGERIFRDFDLLYTNRATTAMRLAKIELEKNRQGISLRTVVNLKGLQVTAGDVVSFNIDRYGWSTAAPKPFEIIDYSLFLGDEENPFIGVELLCRETASGIFDWNSGEETTVDLAPNTSLSSPFTVEDPTNLTLASGDAQLLAKSDGTIISRIKVTWTDSPTNHVFRTIIQAKKSSDSTYETVGFVPYGETVFYIPGVDDGVQYDVKIIAQTRLGYESNEVESLNHSVIGKTGAPSNATSFLFSEDADGTRIFSWANTAEAADVRSGGGYKIRYFLGSTSDWDAMTALHEGLIKFSPYETNQLAAGTYTFAIKAVDSSGNESTTAKFISATELGDPRLAGAILQRSEKNLTWPGSTTNAFIESNVVRAQTSGGWSALPSTWAQLPDSWEAILPNKSPIDYVTPTIDVTGRSLDITFTPLVTGVASGGQTITMESGTDADGGPTGGFVALSQVTGRYVRLKLSVSGTTPFISDMVTILDAASKEERFEDISTATVSAFGTFERIGNGYFLMGTKGGIQAITQAQIVAIQNAGAGFTWELKDKASTLSDGSTIAAAFQIYNAAGVSADALVDVLLRGVKS